VYAAATIFHNIQYHRLVWFYNQNKYGRRTHQARSYGLATLVNSRWLGYLACAGIYALLFDAVPRFMLKPAIGPGDASLRNQLILPSLRLRDCCTTGSTGTSGRSALTPNSALISNWTGHKLA